MPRSPPPQGHRASRRSAHQRGPSASAERPVAGGAERTGRLREGAALRQEGLEPPALGFEGRCSIQLSYWRAFEGCCEGDLPDLNR